MRLPKGVTGFGAVDDLPRISMADKDFKQICYAVSQTLNAKLIKCEMKIGITNNYYHAVFLRREERITILYNPYSAYLAFTYDEYNQCNNHKYIDLADFAEAFIALADFHVLTKEILESHPKAEYLTELAEGELKQIKHWQPKRVADIIFNCWD